MGEFRIETERLSLREWRDQDAVALLPMEQDDHVMEYIGPLGDAAEARRIVEGQILNQRLFGHCFWPIERRADGVLVGFCGLNPAPTNTPVAGGLEIGWRLAHDAWGQGYAFEAASASLRWGFAHRPADRIMAMTVPSNGRSRRLMERLGMTHRPDLEFDHPAFPAGHPLRRHVTYAIDRP